MERLVVIVDDEEDITELVSVNLKKNGFKTKSFFEGKTFFKFLNKSVPDLVILDIMMPEMDGIEVCKVMKNDERYRAIPVIMLTAKSDETDKVLGLELGADDYVTKPFSPKELVSRVKAVLRRTGINAAEDAVLKCGEIVIDPQKYEVAAAGKKIDLTATEFKILRILSGKRGRVFSREQLLDSLWGNEKTVVDRTIDVHIKHLREKLGRSGKIIKNIRGVGYKIEE